MYVKCDIRLATALDGSPGAVVMGGDSPLRGCGLESQLWRLGGHFSHYIAVKIVMVV